MSDTSMAPRGDDPEIVWPKAVFELGWPVGWIEHYANDLAKVRPTALRGDQRDSLRRAVANIEKLLGENHA